MSCPDFRDRLSSAKVDAASVQPPSKKCALFGKACYDFSNYEEQLQKLAGLEDEIRLLVANRTLHNTIDGAVVATQEVDPGSLKPGSTIRSPKNAYFALLQADCSFVVYKTPSTANADLKKYVIARSTPENQPYSNCRFDLQRDRNLILYADVTSTSMISNIVMARIGGGHSVPIPMPPVKKTRIDTNVRVWTSGTSDGGNADYWLALLDTGKLELHSGTPYSDQGALYRSRLLDKRTLVFEQAK
jgi:hypothetical protein